MDSILDTFSTTASGTRPVNAASQTPNRCVGISVSETGGAATRVKLYSHAIMALGACVAADGAAGNSTAGNHIFKVTAVTAQGETELGTASNTLNSAGSKIMVLTGIPIVQPADGASLVTGRNVYMTEAGGATYYKVTSGAGASLTDNTTTTLSVNISDATLTGYSAAPTANTSGILRADIRVPANGSRQCLIPAGASVSAVLPRCEITTGAASIVLYGAT